MTTLLSQRIVVCFFLISYFFLTSCNNEIEKLKIDDLSAHIGYQDNKIQASKNFDDSLLSIRQLINEYLSLELENKNENSSYNFYLARLYGQISNLDFSRLYDFTGKKMINRTLYKNYYDSTYFYSERSLSIDSNNIYSMEVLCRNFYQERERCLINKSEIPFSGLENSDIWNKRWNFIVNNSFRLIKTGRQASDSLLRRISEVALYYLDLSFGDDYAFNKNDRNNINMLVMYGTLYDYLSKFNNKVLIKIDESKIKGKVIPNIKLAETELAMIPLYDYFYDKTGKVLGEAGYECTSHSNEVDIKDRGIGKPVYFDKPSIDESEIIFKLNSDKSYSATYKPVYAKEKVTIEGVWQFDTQNSELILDKDLFAKTMVYCVDLGGDTDEYFYADKKIKFDGKKLLLDARSTNRLTYTLYVADKFTDATDEAIEKYTFDFLKNLSLTNSYITQYIKYLHF